MPKPPRTLFIVDAHALIHRYYHAPFQDLSGPLGSCEKCAGLNARPIIDVEDFDAAMACQACGGTTREPTKATYQFTQSLVKLIRERKPTYLAVAFDGHRKHLDRRKISPDYKAQRKPNDPALKVQLRRCRGIVSALGLCMLDAHGAEADDIMATLTRKYVSDRLHIRLVCRDKDLMPLLADPRIRFYDAHDRQELGPEYVTSKYGVKPSQMADYLALVGDSSDNIKGVEGIGAKTAVKLLQQYGSIEHMLLSNLFKCGTDKTSQKIWEAKGNGTLALSRKLVKLDDRVDLDWADLKLMICKGQIDLKLAAPIFKALGFRRLEKP